MDKRIDTRFRKPTRTKGTPFFMQRNYWAAGAIAVGGLLWIGLECLPKTHKLKLWFAKHLEDSESTKVKSSHLRYSFTDATVDQLLIKAREKAA